MSRRIKIEVYLNQKDKKIILEKAKKLDISASDYLKLKALNRLKENDE